MGFKDPNWICPRISHSHIWIIKQDLWKAKLCVWKIVCEFGAVCLPYLIWLLNYLPSFLPFSVSFSLSSQCSGSLFFFCLLSVCTIFYCLLPSALLPSALSSFLPVSPHPEGNLGEVMATDPDFGARSSGCAVDRMTPFFLMSSDITNEKTSWECLSKCQHL